ncbi:MAG: CAP domain-containing protein [Solirubrobacteraceae bacterium]
MPRSAFVVLIVLTACGALAPAAGARGRSRRRGCADAHTPVTAVSRAQLQSTVVCLINQQRRARGLPALRESARLNRSAQGWTNVMVDDREFTHGSDFSARISAVGFDWSSAGENIATGFGTASAVVTGWMGSTGHCENILSPVYRDVGTGVSDRAIPGYSSQGATWTQDFGLWMGQSQPSHNYGPAAGCPYG